MQCTWTVTLACLIFELLPFVYFLAWILSGACLQNYTSYGYEILWVDRSYQGGVRCTWTVTLAYLIFELLPFVYFLTWILSRAYLQNTLAMVMKFYGWIDLIKGSAVHMNHNSCLLIFWVIALCLLSYWILSGAYLQNYTCYGYEIFSVDRSHQGGVQCTLILTLAGLSFKFLPFFKSCLIFVQSISQKLY